MASVRGNSHHVVVIAEITTPITRIMTLIGRRAAARSIVFRSSGERGADSLSAGGPDSGLRRSATADPPRMMSRTVPPTLRERAWAALPLFIARLRRQWESGTSTSSPALADPKVSTYRTDISPSPASTFRASPYSSPDCSVVTESLALPKWSMEMMRVVNPPPRSGGTLTGPRRRQRSRVHGLPEIRYPHPGHKMRRHRGEDVATVEGVGDGVQMIALLRERDGGGDATQRLRRRNE